jgi:hypothetical protein
MATTMSLKNVRTPAPAWFRKTKRAVSILVNGLIVILLALGYSDNSMVMLILKIGISTAMTALESVLADADVVEEETPEETA